MEIRTVGILMPGEMGHAIGRVLGNHGMRVITCLQGRSERTRARAAAAGIVAVADDGALVREADLLLSILAPAHARALADRIASALLTTGATVCYVDCNAIAPQTARAVGAVLEAAGARYVDGGIIGGPPKDGAAGPRLYLSGAEAAALLQLADHGLDVRLAGTEIGQASALKLCYAALTKGLTALATESLTAARLLGLDAALRTELLASQGDLLSWIDRSMPGMPPKAWRWVGEMEEIAGTFAAAGLPPGMLEGAAALYRLVSDLAPELAATSGQDAGAPAADVPAQVAMALTRRNARGPGSLS